jgi:hypothetical protein
MERRNDFHLHLIAISESSPIDDENARWLPQMAATMAPTKMIRNSGFGYLPATENRPTGTARATHRGAECVLLTRHGLLYPIDCD